MLLPKIKLISPKFLLALILTLSFSVRIWNINGAPPSMYWDEMDAGYQAYSILKTGKDYFGETPFLVIHSFADFRAPILIYLMIPFVAVLGLSTLAVKLPVILLGSLTILLIYILSKQLFKNEATALLSALLVAFAPWNIQYSRIAYEAIPMLAFFLLGLCLFLKGLAKPKYLILSAIFFSLTLFTYNTMKLFVPLILGILIVIHFKKLTLNKYAILSLVIFVLSLSAGFYGTIFHHGGQRFSELSIFTDPQNANHVDDMRQASNLSYKGSKTLGDSPRLIDKIIYNKPFLFLDHLTQNYLQAFSFDFLFVKGDSNLRHSPSAVGELLRIEVITVLLGLVFLITNFKKNKSSSILIFLWILIAPISAVVTRDGSNHATRLFMLFPSLSIVSALGLIYFLQILNTKAKLPALILIGGLWAFCVISYLNFYFGAYNLENARAFQFRFNEAVSIALENKNNYEYVIIDDRTDSALMNYLFLTAYDPIKFQTLVKSKTLNNDISGFFGDQLDNVILMQPKIKNWDNAFLTNQFDKNFLLIVTADQMREASPDKVDRKLTLDQEHKDTLYYVNKEPAFYIISSKNK